MINEKIINEITNTVINIGEMAQREKIRVTDQDVLEYSNKLYTELDHQRITLNLG